MYKIINYYKMEYMILKFRQPHIPARHIIIHLIPMPSLKLQQAMSCPLFLFDTRNKSVKQQVPNRVHIFRTTLL